MLKSFNLAYGIISGLAFYFLGNVGIGLVFYFTSLPEETLPWLAGGLYFTSVLIGAAAAARRAGGKGLYYGLAVACLFFLVLWGLGAAVLPCSSWSSSLGHKLLLALAAGMAGGILGVFLAD
ncbi:MAG: TIGR04086 family membrane protein [Armatimonadetes bacterium]|nr:TIGR04086 family membrane protein [Armatimonadota bacterium]